MQVLDSISSALAEKGEKDAYEEVPAKFGTAIIEITEGEPARPEGHHLSAVGHDWKSGRCIE